MHPAARGSDRTPETQLRLCRIERERFQRGHIGQCLSRGDLALVGCREAGTVTQQQPRRLFGWQRRVESVLQTVLPGGGGGLDLASKRYLIDRCAQRRLAAADRYMQSRVVREGDLYL